MRTPTVILLLALISVGCGTTESLQNRVPSYTVAYESTDHSALRDCVNDKILNQKGFASILNTGTTANRSYIIQPLIGFYGPQGTVWVANFYSDRAEIFGTASLRGDQGKYLVPFIKQCAGQ